MILSNIGQRAHGRYQRAMNRLLFRRPLKLRNTGPYISFTFDDFPRSALLNGGYILRQLGVRATYYASLGLMGTVSPTGEIFTSDDIKDLYAEKHELGCHTFTHCHSWNTAPQVFEDSIIKNKSALEAISPGACFESFSYPIVGPRPFSKYRTGKHFCSCRGGGQTFNVHTLDLNLLKAYFLEKSRHSFASVKNIIDLNRKSRGWLIFATHDISNSPTIYGCTQSFFVDVVKCSIDSEATILPVNEVLEELRSVHF